MALFCLRNPREYALLTAHSTESAALDLANFMIRDWLNDLSFTAGRRPVKLLDTCFTTPRSAASDSRLDRPRNSRSHFSSLVKAFAIDLIAGAAKSTIGTMVAQAASHEVNHSLINKVPAARRKYAMAEAIADVNPDWITANRKCA
jgi:hypothetical protein